MNNELVMQTWLLLKVTYTVVPVLLGLDKCFMGMIVNWAQYVSPMIKQNVPASLPIFITSVGIIEIIAGLIVWFSPVFGAYLIIAWIGLIIVNLISMNLFYDIIARDIVIAVGALALAWLTHAIQS